MTQSNSPAHPAPPVPVATILRRLREFQIRRLETTYSDIVEDPATRTLGLFFIHDLYGTQDVKDRDEGVVRVFRAVEPRLGAKVVAGLKQLLRLHRITHEMDRSLALWLERALGDGEIDMETYEEGYRLSSTYEMRDEQIRLSVDAIAIVHRISGMPVVGPTLKAVSWIARRVGATQLLESMSRGYDAFRNVKDVLSFVQLVKERETARLDRIFQATAVGSQKNAPKAPEGPPRAAAKPARKKKPKTKTGT